MPILKIKQIFESFLTGDIDKSSMLSYIIFLIEKSNNDNLRIEALKLLCKTPLQSELSFKFLENLLISDENYIIKAYAAKYIIKNFPNKAFSPLKWALRSLEWPVLNSNENVGLGSILKEIRTKDDVNLNSLLKLKEHVFYKDKIFFLNNGLLNLKNLGINDIREIEGIENLTKLNELNLSGNNIKRIKGLENLTKLKKLNLSSNKIKEIEGLKTLTNLNQLYLYNNNINEIKGLENLINLHYLNLDKNQITEIKDLNNNINLTTLYLNDNSISKIKNLDSLQELYFLALNDNAISTIEGLNKLNNLRILQLANNKIQKIEGLDNLKKLTNLNLYNNLITQLKDPNLPNLYFFSLDNNKIPKLQLKEFYQKHRKFRYFHYF
ncbi:MAG: leucine-rich repeat domain-containing protein [Promethearchaeota archaeon]|nr:MAG: leucine-rich repeat domain-containing protein [Candidatus Lokiarchaeota archaeon]